MSDLVCAQQTEACQTVARSIKFIKPAAMGADGATNDRMLSDCGLSEGSLLSQSMPRYTEKLINGNSCIHEVDSQCMHKPRQTGVSIDGDAEGHKVDGLKELLELAEEYESQEAAKRRLSRVECHVCGTAVLEYTSKENEAADTLESAVKKDNCHRTSGQRSRAPNSKWPDLKKIVPQASKGQVPTPSSAHSLSLSRATVKASTKVQTEGAHNMDLTDYSETNESVNKNGIEAVSQRSITNCTVPRPFSLATDKRAGNGGRLADNESEGQTQKAHPLNGTPGNLSMKNAQVSQKMGSKADVAKFVHPESMKHQEEILEKRIAPMEAKQAKDNTAAVSSVQSGSTTSKTKASSVTSTSGFNFRCQERAEKRKEFNARLEERKIAKEEQKNWLHERSKEQSEEELKLLRRSMTYKAHPMPSFYAEGHPAKAELKKIPPTRARSPKFTRRNSHPGCETGCSRYCKFMHYDVHYSPKSLQKPAERNTENINNVHTKKLVKSLSKKLPDPLAELKSHTESNCPTSDIESIDVEVVAVNGSIDKLDVKLSPIISLLSEHEIDEEKYGGHGAWDDKFSNPAEMEYLCLENSKFTNLIPSPVEEVTERPYERSNVNGVSDLKTGIASDTGLSFSDADKLKPAVDSSHDLTVKGNRTTKRD